MRWSSLCAEFYKRWRWCTDLYSPVQINFENCNFLARYAVTMFAAYTLWLRETKNCITTIKALPNTVAGNYLVQCGLFELLGETGYLGSMPVRVERDSLS